MDILSHFAGQSDDDEEDEEDEDDDFMGEESETIFKYTREPSVDELLGYINGTTQTHPSSIANENAPPNATTKATKKSSSRKKKRRQRKKKQAMKEVVEKQPNPNNLKTATATTKTNTETTATSEHGPEDSEEMESLSEKLRLASIDPSVIFDESKFEDDDADHEIESFRRALEDAHKQSAETKPKVALHVPFFAAPVDPAK